jgi:hypothetical protein
MATKIFKGEFQGHDWGDLNWTIPPLFDQMKV